ncbi:ComF family protein [Phormidium sp. FACHB-592]|uniref:ComF family protein n=1 Tax=Stenomitos frigidus AS-A4 TaxID=2933935 RepID=A0ABV0KLA4_9CYAN|nr:ComF family protein [Phormidium sp. FACHB-592]MBD2073242.1 ComF family protein [Phormidium sp. FACHB-592]
MSGFSDRFYGLVNLLLQAQCPLCQRTTADTFCQDCQRQVQRCQFPSPGWIQQEQLPVFAWGRYNGVLRRTIAAFKYEKKPHLSQPLAQWLAHAWLNATDRTATFTVVPIPMHPSKQRQRGFNQAELLATHFCDQTRLSPQAQGLARSRETTAQFELSANDREQNLADAFSLGAAFQKRSPTGSVLLLDDIYTTGATARSAAQTLRRHGIQVQGLIVLARAEQERQENSPPVLFDQKYR